MELDTDFRNVADDVGGVTALDCHRRTSPLERGGNVEPALQPGGSAE